MKPPKTTSTILILGGAGMVGLQVAREASMAIGAPVPCALDARLRTR
jgi:hypothetical protein